MSNRKSNQHELRDGGLVAATGTRGRFAGRRVPAAGLKSHLPDGYKAYLVHYRFSGCGDHTSLPGVERVMDSHRNLLRQLGVATAILTGETENDQDPHVIVFKPIGILSNGARGRLSTKEIASSIDALTHNATTAFHNTTIACRYNPEYGEAAARLVDASIQGERATAVLWIQDIEQVGLWRFLPRQEGAKIVVASPVVRKRLKNSIKQIQITNGLRIPSYDIHVIPNPIDSSFFTIEVSAPQNLADLAPQFERFTQQYKLPQSVMTTEKIIFSGRDYAKFLLPGRIAHNKGIKEAIEAVKSFSNMYQRAILIITNGPDFDTIENRNYWEDIKKLILHHYSRKEGLQVLLLGGVNWRYMKWLYMQSDLLLAPFKNEGFGLPPIEAACCGLASAISDDPALLQTTGANGLVISSVTWANEPREVARMIYDYLSSGQKQIDVAALQTRAMSVYHPLAVVQLVKNVFDLATA